VTRRLQLSFGFPGTKSDGRISGRSQKGPRRHTISDFSSKRPDYQVTDESLSMVGCRQLPSEACDLLDVIEAVGTVDRLKCRPSSTVAGNAWSRRLSVVVGVRDPDRWTSNSGRLGELLQWLTDDDWDIRFESRKTAWRPGESALRLPIPRMTVEAVALFSGGLDSLCGAVRDLHEGRSLILLSVASNQRLATRQRRIAAGLNGLGRVPRAEVWAQLQGASARESSQRTRGFVFLGLGAVAACEAGADELRVYENGIGAINLAMNRAQVGAHTSKAMHPKTLALAESLFSAVLGKRLPIVNPNAFRTKAEMCAELSTNTFPLVPLALSCDTAHTHRVSPVPSCGKCTSCILRRQSLIASGQQGLDAATPHRVDAFRDGPGEHVQMRAMFSQVARMNRCLRSPRPWHALCEEFPDLLLLDGVHGQGTAHRLALADRNRLLELYGRYVGEWHGLPIEAVSHYLGSPPSAQAA